MISIAHIIHPVIVPATSDLVVAQPITFETMKIARDFALQTQPQTSTPLLDVQLYAVQYSDEDTIHLPSCFTRAPGLERSIKDIKTFKKQRKLALIKDIIDTLYEATRTTGADYLVYTNVDIALMPHFYSTLLGIIEQGYDAFVINRRTITDRYSTIEEIPLMYAEIGQSHVGYDCFIFKREVYPSFDLGTISIGTAWIGRSLLANMVAHANRFKEFRAEHLTFHIGDSLAWRNPDYEDYFQQNKNEYDRIFAKMDKEKGPFDPVWRSYLVDTAQRRQFPNF